MIQVRAPRIIVKGRRSLLIPSPPMARPQSSRRVTVSSKRSARTPWESVPAVSQKATATPAARATTISSSCAGHGLRILATPRPTRNPRGATSQRRGMGSVQSEVWTATTTTSRADRSSAALIQPSLGVRADLRTSRKPDRFRVVVASSAASCPEAFLVAMSVMPAPASLGPAFPRKPGPAAPGRRALRSPRSLL